MRLEYDFDMDSSEISGGEERVKVLWYPVAVTTKVMSDFERKYLRGEENEIRKFIRRNLLTVENKGSRLTEQEKKLIHTEMRGIGWLYLDEQIEGQEAEGANPLTDMGVVVLAGTRSTDLVFLSKKERNNYFLSGYHLHPIITDERAGNDRDKSYQVNSSRGGEVVRTIVGPEEYRTAAVKFFGVADWAARNARGVLRRAMQSLGSADEWRGTQELGLLEIMANLGLVNKKGFEDIQDFLVRGAAGIDDDLDVSNYRVTQQDWFVDQRWDVWHGRNGREPLQFPKTVVLEAAMKRRDQLSRRLEQARSPRRLVTAAAFKEPVDNAEKIEREIEALEKSSLNMFSAEWKKVWEGETPRTDVPEKLRKAVLGRMTKALFDFFSHESGFPRKAMNFEDPIYTARLDLAVEKLANDRNFVWWDQMQSERYLQSFESEIGDNPQSFYFMAKALTGRLLRDALSFRGGDRELIFGGRLLTDRMGDVEALQGLAAGATRVWIQDLVPAMPEVMRKVAEQKKEYLPQKVGQPTTLEKIKAAVRSLGIKKEETFLRVLGSEISNPALKTLVIAAMVSVPIGAVEIGVLNTVLAQNIDIQEVARQLGWGGLGNLPESGNKPPDQEYGRILYAPSGVSINDRQQEFFMADNLNHLGMSLVPVVSRRIQDLELKATEYKPEQLVIAYDRAQVDGTFLTPLGWHVSEVYSRSGEQAGVYGIGQISVSGGDKQIIAVLERDRVPDLKNTRLGILPISTGSYEAGGGGNSQTEEQKLSGDPRLNTIYQQMDTGLKSAPGDVRAQTRVVKEFLAAYGDYVTKFRFYSLDAKPGGIPQEEWLANNPQAGYFCSIAADATDNMLRSVGVKSFGLTGMPVADFNGQLWGSFSHEKNLVLLPDGEVVVFDGTPPGKDGLTPTGTGDYLKTPRPGFWDYHRGEVREIGEVVGGAVAAMVLWMTAKELYPGSKSEELVEKIKKAFGPPQKDTTEDLPLDIEDTGNMHFNPEEIEVLAGVAWHLAGLPGDAEFEETAKADLKSLVRVAAGPRGGMSAAAAMAHGEEVVSVIEEKNMQEAYKQMAEEFGSRIAHASFPPELNEEIRMNSGPRLFADYYRLAKLMIKAEEQAKVQEMVRGVIEAAGEQVEVSQAEDKRMLLLPVVREMYNGLAETEKKKAGRYLVMLYKIFHLQSG